MRKQQALIVNYMANKAPNIPNPSPKPRPWAVEKSDLLTCSWIDELLITSIPRTACFAATSDVPSGKVISSVQSSPSCTVESAVSGTRRSGNSAFVDRVWTATRKRCRSEGEWEQGGKGDMRKSTGVDRTSQRDSTVCRLPCVFSFRSAE